MILTNDCNIIKSEKCKGVWILSAPTVYNSHLLSFVSVSQFIRTLVCWHLKTPQLTLSMPASLGRMSLTMSMPPASKPGLHIGHFKPLLHLGSWLAWITYYHIFKRQPFSNVISIAMNFFRPHQPCSPLNSHYKKLNWSSNKNSITFWKNFTTFRVSLHINQILCKSVKICKRHIKKYYFLSHVFIIIKY